MKKILPSILFICLSVILSSCQKTVNQYVTIQAYYQGATHQYVSGVQMILYQGYLQVDGGQNTSGAYGSITDGFGLGVAASGIGNYQLSCCSPSSFDIFLVNSSDATTTYTTETQGGWGTINITEFDSSSHYIKGTFSGTVVNTVFASDSFSVSRGSFAGTYTVN